MSEKGFYKKLVDKWLDDDKSQQRSRENEFYKNAESEKVGRKPKEKPKEYLKTMLDCIDENGELCIAREIDEVTFCTAETEEDATHIEKVKIDVALADYNSLCEFYENALRDIGVFIAEYAAAAECSVFVSRMVTFAKRINKLIELNAPESVLQIEKCMFIDSILLFKASVFRSLIALDDTY